MGNAGQAAYCAAKAGLIGLTKSMAKELATRNIRVNAVAPGYIETDMTGILTPEQKEGILKSIPLGRVGKPEEIADAVVFLASERANYITGQVLAVDGGMGM
jgi:3-oxoacyl-[acyl-carrier protein] reductase